ncbi:hypothetical protein C8J57DRAFT_1610104 [Mycena rebaudengoi]|nr:hypothetical protein C8J57DRAFT_1610104 [Mycena rebaudengoi]
MDVLQIEHVRSMWFGDSESVHKWLQQRQSSLPPDLKHTWTESVFIVELLQNLKPNTKSAAHPSCQFDSIFEDILSNHPHLLELLRVQLTLGWKMFPWDFDILGFTREVLRPLCTFNGLLVDCSFSEGDSPLDFLSNFQRCGALYEDQHNTAEKAVIHWIHFTKTVMHGSYFWWAGLIEPSQVVLREIETLDLSQLCNLFAMDSWPHECLHKYFGLKDSFDYVIGWLQRHPSPPMDVIELWERQRANFFRCGSPS